MAEPTVPIYTGIKASLHGKITLVFQDPVYQKLNRGFWKRIFEEKAEAMLTEAMLEASPDKGEKVIDLIVTQPTIDERVQKFLAVFPHCNVPVAILKGVLK